MVWLKISHKLISGKMTLTKKIALAFSLLLIGGVFGWKIVYVPTGETHNIVLTEDGFEPKKVSIQAGDVVRFTTTRKEPFWPASNSHPIHDIYSAFDPRKPIAPNDSWEFKFKKVGAWEYHDHLFPYYRGTIVVAKAGSVSLDPSTFRNQIASLISQKGGERAFLELKSAVGGEEIPQQHLLAHIFGEELFEKEGVEGIGVCDETFTFGCYHGFFTAAVGQEGAGIVSELDKKCIELFGEMGLGCPHGIGHGLGEYYGGDRLSEQLAVCDTLTWQGRLFGCRGGVFMEHNFPTVVGAEDAEATVRALEGTNYFSPCDSVSQNAKSTFYF